MLLLKGLHRYQLLHIGDPGRLASNTQLRKTYNRHYNFDTVSTWNSTSFTPFVSLCHCPTGPTTQRFTRVCHSSGARRATFCCSPSLALLAASF